LQQLEAIRTELDPRWWQALYQQSPRAETGDLFRRDWFRYYTTTDLGYGLTYLLAADPDADAKRVNHKAVAGGGHIFSTVDLAVSDKSSADYTVISTWGRVPSTGDLLLLDVVRDRFQGPDIVPQLQRVQQRWQPARIIVEQVAFQLSLIQEAKRAGLPVVGRAPKGDKTARATFAAARLEGGNVWFPAQATWLSDVEGELLSFPTGGHDDIVDTVSMAVAETGQQTDRRLRVG
jgi:predicted phage terminase large subunit-like protein